jgi:hypothetical protein
MSTDVSEKNFASICRLEKQASQETKAKKVASRALFHAGLLLGLFFNPEDGGDVFLQNGGLHSTALYHRR